MADSPYFDPAYFDRSYFGADAQVTAGRRPVRVAVLPPVPEPDEDDEFLAALL